MNEFIQLYLHNVWFFVIFSIIGIAIASSVIESVLSVLVTLISVCLWGEREKK